MVSTELSFTFNSETCCVEFPYGSPPPDIQKENRLKRKTNAIFSAFDFFDFVSSDGLLTESDRKNLKRLSQHGYISYNNQTFIDIMIKVHEYFDILALIKEKNDSITYETRRIKPSFLDVGCGIGSKMMLANKLGFSPYGVEYTKSYVKKAKKLFPFFEDRIFHNDASKFNYTGHNVIYFYRPFESEIEQQKLERQICMTADDNTFIIPIYSEFPNDYGIKLDSYLASYNVRPIKPDIWIKIQDESEYAQLRQKIQLFSD